MWQRIQTLYIAIATGLVAAMFFSNFATVIGPGGEELGIRYHEKTAYLIMLIMILSAQICSLFSYKSGFLQARVATIASLVLIGFQIWLGVDFFRLKGEMVFNLTGVFPITAAILNMLAARSAMIDEFTLTAVGSTRKARKKARKR